VTYDAGVDMGDGGSVDSGRPETPDTDESSEVSIIASSPQITVVGHTENFND